MSPASGPSNSIRAKASSRAQWLSRTAGDGCVVPMRAAIARDQYKRRSSFGDSKRAARGGPPTMRLVRITSALIAFYLLISAATAYAECAWVLWIEGEGRGGQLMFATGNRA